MGLSSAAMVSAFVAGATGYTGREVVRELAARGIAVVAHVRPDSPRLGEWRARFAELGAGVKVDASPWNLDAVGAALKEHAPTHLFALLGTTRARAKAAAESGAARADYEAIDYGLTATLIDAAQKAEKKPRFIYLSAAGVNPRSKNAYIEVRWRAEQKLIASGLSYAIARPSFITGTDREENRPGERIGSKVADSVLSFAGAIGAKKLRDRYRSTDAKTLAQALVRIALEDKNAIYESEALR